MPDLFLRNIPSIKEREFKYRGRMSSDELNEMQDEAFADILDLFNKSNQLQAQVYETRELAMVESECYSMRLADALSKQRGLEEQLQNMTSPFDYRTQTKYVDAASSKPDQYGAHVDMRTRDITPAYISSRSKTRLYDETYNEYRVPDSLQVAIGPDSFHDNQHVLNIEDIDLYGMFDGSNGSAWLRKVITDLSVTEIENEIVIGLPEDIITTRLINQIIISPFPSGYLDIMDVQVKSNGAWETIPTFKDHVLCTEKMADDTFGNHLPYWSINDAPDIRLCFRDIQTSQLKIKLRQRHCFIDQENHRKIWYLGIRNLDAVRNVYTGDYSEFDIDYEFPEIDRNITIYDVQPIFNNASQSADGSFGITKEYYYYDDDNNYHRITSSVPFLLDGHKLKVRFNMEGSQNAPSVHSCKVKYKIS